MNDYDVPEAFVCPISLDIMRDPVILGSTGLSFENEEIQAWLNNHNSNPMTNEELTGQDRILIQNHSLRSAIEEFVKRAAGRIIPANEIVVGERLGSGADKDVFRATWENVEVAVLKFRRATLTEKEARMFVRLGQHPHLVQFFGRTFVDDSEVPVVGSTPPTAATSIGSPDASNALVNEYAPLGDLSSYLGDINDSGHTLTASHLLLVAEQIADGMTRIHASNILHRDLAGRNIMVFSLSREDPSHTLVKVGDYGLAEVARAKGYLHTGGSSPGPVRWMAPETIRRRKWSKESDVFSYGVLLWEIFSYGAYPYNHISSDECVARGVRDGILELTQPAHRCPNELWALATRCMNSEGGLRPTFNEIKIQLQLIRLSPLTYPASTIHGGMNGEGVDHGRSCTVRDVSVEIDSGALRDSMDCSSKKTGRGTGAAGCGTEEVSEEDDEDCRRQRRVSLGNRDIKLLVVGDSGVGKSCLLLRFCHPEHEHTNSPSTIGVDFKKKIVRVDGDKVPVTIWDSAGQERFHVVTSSYYRDAHGVMIVYDVCDLTSFGNVSYWLNEIRAHSSLPSQVHMVLLGNKCDSPIAKREVSFEEGKRLADSVGLPFFETSAEQNVCVDMAFGSMITSIYRSSPATVDSAQRSDIVCIGHGDRRRNWSSAFSDLCSKYCSW